MELILEKSLLVSFLLDFVETYSLQAGGQLSRKILESFPGNGDGDDRGATQPFSPHLSNAEFSLILSCTNMEVRLVCPFVCAQAHTPTHMQAFLQVSAEATSQWTILFGHCLVSDIWHTP